MQVGTIYVTLHQLAKATGLSSAWLKTEAHAGRIPHIKDRKQLKFNLKVVESALAAYAAESVGGNA